MSLVEKVSKVVAQDFVLEHIQQSGAESDDYRHSITPTGL